MRTAHLTQGANLIDDALNEINKNLIAALPWLDNAYGRAQRIHEKRDNRSYYKPAVRTNTNEYIDVSPCDDLGAHSFAIIDDPEEIDISAGLHNAVTANFSVVFWFDTRKVDTYKLNGLDALKIEILNALKRKGTSRSASWRVNRIYGNAANVYREYSFDESVNQFTTAPYMALRFTGEIKASEIC